MFNKLVVVKKWNAKNKWTWEKKSQVPLQWLRGGAETPQEEERVLALVIFKASPIRALLFTAVQMHSKPVWSTDLNPEQHLESGFVSLLSLFKNDMQLVMWKMTLIQSDGEGFGDDDCEGPGAWVGAVDGECEGALEGVQLATEHHALIMHTSNKILVLIVNCFPVELEKK